MVLHLVAFYKRAAERIWRKAWNFLGHADQVAKPGPRAGDGLYTNRRRKILTITEETSRGDHDTWMAACDCER